MAKIYLDRIKQRYGWTGGKYQNLMSMIIANNHEAISRAVARAKVKKITKFGERMVKRKRQPAQLWIPQMKDVLPKRSIFIRKGAEQGELLADSLRSRLSKDLRKTVAEYLVTGAETMQYKRGKRAGRMNPELIGRFQSAITSTFANYTKAGPDGVPRNIKTIAVTETRSAIDGIKWAFATRLLSKNPGASVMKRWKHNTHLVNEPRPGHEEIDGVEVGMNQAFRVAAYTKSTQGGTVAWKKTGQYFDLRFPHDPGAPAEEVINCQCEVDYIFSFGEGVI